MKISEFKIENQRITNVIFKINENGYKDKVDYQFHTQVTIGKSEKISNKAKVTLQFEVFKEEELETRPYYLQCTIEGIFSWEEGVLNDDIIEDLLRINAPAVLLSYIRSTTSLITLSAGFVPLVIPLINFKE